MAVNEAKFDLVMIGGGPAGYVGAIRAAQLGMKVACIEREHLGGICLNWGCIPTKALLAQAEFYHRLKHEADDWGVKVKDVSHDWSKVIGRSRNVAGQLNKGIGGLLKKNKVTHIEGHAKITKGGDGSGGACKIDVTDPDGKLTDQVTCRHVIIATGAGPRELPFAPFDGEKIIGYKQAMSLEKQPKELVVIGAGAIGMEFAYFYHCYGTKVTVIEMLDRLLPAEDDEVCKAIERSFKKLGVDIHTSTKTTDIKTTKNGVEVTTEPADGGDSKTFKADKVLVAIGVQGKFDGLFDEKLGIETEKGHIKVDKGNYVTSVKNVYAVGDVIGPPWLAHVASEEAVVCVEKIAGEHAHEIDYDAIPACTYCIPQVASLGKTERALKDDGKKKGEDYKVGKFPFAGSGKAKAVGNAEGFVKIISDAKYGEILGVHMIGENVTELLAEMCLAKRLEATADEVIATMHAHPTLSEAVHEAALDVEGKMIHF